MKEKIREVIVVEGRYDKNALLQVVNATVVETGGVGVFNDKEKLAFFRRLAESRGLIVLTDSDGAGFVIRNYLKGALPKDKVKQAYVPDIYGKERRKQKAGKEGKLGVEGMRPEVLLNALMRAGATIDGAESAVQCERISKADMYKRGLSGGTGSREKRAALIKSLDLPEKLTADALLDVLNATMTREEFFALQL